jgi:hypothetical protein
VRDAHADGSLSPDFTEDDLFCLLGDHTEVTATTP